MPAAFCDPFLVKSFELLLLSPTPFQSEEQDGCGKIATNLKSTDREHPRETWFELVASVGLNRKGILINGRTISVFIDRAGKIGFELHLSSAGRGDNQWSEQKKGPAPIWLDPPWSSKRSSKLGCHRQ